MSASTAARLLRQLPALVVATAVGTAAMPALAAPPSPTPATTAAPNDALMERNAKRVRNYGVGTLSLGAVMIGVGAGLEHKRRTEICKTELSEDHGNACEESLRANVTVLAMGTAFLLGGAVLTAIGVKRIKEVRARRVAFAPQVGRGFAGATFVARF